MKKPILLLCVTGLFLFACGDEAEEKKLTGDHVWKAKTEALEMAKEVQGVTEDLLEEQKKKMEELNK